VKAPLERRPLALLAMKSEAQRLSYDP